MKNTNNEIRKEVVIGIFQFFGWIILGLFILVLISLPFYFTYNIASMNGYDKGFVKGYTYGYDSLNNEVYEAFARTSCNNSFILKNYNKSIELYKHCNYPSLEWNYFKFNK